MAATSGYQAGTEANAAALSYGVEATWGTAPATMFQAIRFMSETLGQDKTRARPGEIPGNREVLAAVTTQQGASGGINFAFSYGTYDDLLSVLLGNDWGTAQTIAGVAGDITITNLTSTTATLSSTTANKFQNIALGQWIRTFGFTNAANNDFWRVTARASNVSMTLTKANTGAAPVTETPGTTLAQVRAQTIQNGKQFKSLYFQKKLAPALWLQYPGLFISGATLSGGVGQFLQGSFTTLAQQELSATADASTGGITAAPTGRVHDPVTGWRGAFIADAPIGATLQKFSLSIQNTGAAGEFGMGSPSMQGILQGSMEVTGTFDVFFRDFTLYAKYQAETSGAFEIITADAAGNAYAITVLNANIFAKIPVAGPNQGVMASFTVEGNPQAGGGTIQIDKLPAT
jgi:hypothetical protein